MKRYFKYSLHIFLLALLISGCKMEFENHNAASEESVLQTPEAYPGMILGMTKHFTQNAYKEIVRGPGVIAREIGATNTYLTENELESGDIPNENSSISLLWRYLHYERGIAEKITDHIDDVTFPNSDEKEGIKAYAYFFRGMTTAYLAFYWEKATTVNDSDNKAEFVSRTDALNAALGYLDQALNIFNSNANAVNYINSIVSLEFSVVDVINVFKARIYMELGDYAQAIQSANNVDLTTRSVWTYDGSTSNRNPIWVIQYDPGSNERWKPLENLGVNADPADGRLNFYIDTATPTNLTSNTCGFITRYLTGFWDSNSESVPVYLPDEIKLIKAEAYAHMGGANLVNAVVLIDEVRMDNSDIFNVNANLGPWTGNAADQQAVLDEVYYNISMELYLQGLRWLAHRRIYPNHLNNVTPPVNCSKERTRNYYPYPFTERANNPNTPPDPSI